MNKPSNLMLIVAGVLSFWILTQPALADLYNGDFSEDLDGWIVDPINSVKPSGDDRAEFLQGEPGNQYPNSTLSQIFTLDQEALELSFYFVMITPGGETDIFTASLNGNTFYTKDSDYGGGVYEETFIYDVSNLAGQTVELTFDLQHDYEGSETTVLLDNVAVSLVPAPGAVLLASIGLSCAGWKLRKRQV
jgi:hypothetical protein